MNRERERQLEQVRARLRWVTASEARAFAAWICSGDDPDKERRWARTLESYAQIRDDADRELQRLIQQKEKGQHPA